MSLLLDSTLKVSFILLLVLGATVLLRKQSAAVRHWVLAVAVVCAAAIPLLNSILPRWDLGLSAFPSGSSYGSQIEPAEPVVTTTTVLQEPSVRPVYAFTGEPGFDAASNGLRIWALLRLLWIAGTGFSLLILLVGLARLKWVAAGARHLHSGRSVELAAAISSVLGLRRPVGLLQSEHPTLLVTWGLARPKIILPREAPHWPEERARIILHHELAHIRRGDWAVQMIGEVLRCVYWFNPIVWLACRRLRQESEYACDDAVLNEGIDGVDYATQLLDLARTLHAERGLWLPAAAMARPSSLERRIRTMLNPTVNRRRLTPVTRFVTLAVLVGLAAPIAALSAQNTFFTFSGSVVDGTSRVLPNTTCLLTNTNNQAKYEVRSDSSGRFEFVGLPPGEYALEVKQPGFATFRERVTVAGQNVERSIELQVGSLEETITVSGNGTRVPTADQFERRQEARRKALERVQRALEFCRGNGNAGPGGNILPPSKLTDVRPEYPDHLRNANIGGTVTMEAVIGPDGLVQDVSTVSSPHPDLERLAVDAVRQWEFTSTLLNCTPIEVRMQVTTNFIAAPPPPPPPPPPTTGVARPGVINGVGSSRPGERVGSPPGVHSPVRVGGNIKPPRKIRDVRAAYPDEARATGVQGVVVLEVTLGRDGAVMSADVVRSIPLLDAAALAAVRQWRFEPVLMNGAPTEALMTVTVNFTLAP